MHLQARRRTAVVIPASMLERGIVEHTIHAAFLASRRVMIVLKSHLHSGTADNVTMFESISQRYPAGSVDVLVRDFNSSQWRDAWVTDRNTMPVKQWMSHSRYLAILELLRLRESKAGRDAGTKREGDGVDVHIEASRRVQEEAERAMGGSGGMWQVYLDADEVVDPWRLCRLVVDLQSHDEAGASMLAVQRESVSAADVQVATEDASRRSTGREASTQAWASGLGCTPEAACPLEEGSESSM